MHFFLSRPRVNVPAFPLHFSGATVPFGFIKLSFPRPCLFYKYLNIFFDEKYVKKTLCFFSKTLNYTL